MMLLQLLFLGLAVLSGGEHPSREPVDTLHAPIDYREPTSWVIFLLVDLSWHCSFCLSMLQPQQSISMHIPHGHHFPVLKITVSDIQ